MTATIFYDADTDPGLITARRVAVIGYGSQGHAHARNLADSGVDVVVGLREGSGSWAAATEAGLSVAAPVDAAESADLVMMLVPDQHQPAVYAELQEHLHPGDALFGWRLQEGEPYESSSLPVGQWQQRQRDADRDREDAAAGGHRFQLSRDLQAAARGGGRSSADQRRPAG